jgi:hypothetical protein
MHSHYRDLDSGVDLALVLHLHDLQPLVIIPRAGRPLDVALERGAYTGGEHRHIDHVVVAEQGYCELAVVGECSHAEPYTGDERGERHGLEQPSAGKYSGDGGAGTLMTYRLI